MNFLLAAFLLMTSSFSLAKSIAFLGDSITTGGAAHPYLALEAERFYKIFTGAVKIASDDDYRKIVAELGYQHSGEDKPQRLPLSRREFINAFYWSKDALLHRLSVDYLDAEEFSWSYLLAKRLGYNGDNILIAAKDGERSSHLLRQVDRLLDATASQLPDKIFIFFTGNDLCGPSLEWVTSSQAYGENIEAGVRYLLRNGIPPSTGTDIYLIDPLGSLQLFSSQSIKNKTIPFYSKTISCQQLQAEQFTIPPEPNLESDTSPEKLLSYLLFYNFIGHSPGRYCTSLFSIAKGDTEAKLELSKRIVGYRKNLQELGKRLTDQIGTEVRFKHISSTSKLLFEADDIANDCFHLSLYGQHKIADAIYKELE